MQYFNVKYIINVSVCVYNTMSILLSVSAMSIIIINAIQCVYFLQYNINAISMACAMKCNEM